MAPRKKTEEIVETVQAAAEAPVKKTRTRKTAVEKALEAAEAAVAAPKKRAPRAAKTQTEVLVQWWGKEVSGTEVAERIKQIWAEDMGKKPADLKDLKIYIKPEENLAHYVINGEITGHIVV